MSLQHDVPKHQSDQVEVPVNTVQSILLREKLKELKSEIDHFRTENNVLANLRNEHEEVRQKLCCFACKENICVFSLASFEYYYSYSVISLQAGSHFRCYIRCGTSGEAASSQSIQNPQGISLLFTCTLPLQAISVSFWSCVQP